MENTNIYALLVSVGNYDCIKLNNLPTFYTDLCLMRTAISKGLCVPVENIRLISGNERNGIVLVKYMLKALSEFMTLLRKEDTFLFYFSGHGAKGKIYFSDGEVCQQELIDLISKMSIKCKIAIFDCCESGGFSSKSSMVLKSDDDLSEIIGHGIKVLAASARDDVARLGPGGIHSFFTEALSLAMLSPATLRNGYRDLCDICDYTRQIMNAWNLKHQNEQQSPVFKSSIVGNTYFRVRNVERYQSKSITYETENYAVASVKPLHTVNEKRYSVFVSTGMKKTSDMLAVFTREIADKLRFENVYSNKKSELRFHGKPTKVVWCYFGCDDNDIANNNFYAHSVWAVDTICEKYFRGGASSEEVGDIEICWNKSYAMLRSMVQKHTIKDDFIRRNKELLTEIINLAQRFANDLDKLFNKEKTISVLLPQYGQWISIIQCKYLALSDIDIPPVEIKQWADEILNMAGDLLDISFILENAQKSNFLNEREIWIVKNALSKYYKSLEIVESIQPN